MIEVVISTGQIHGVGTREKKSNVGLLSTGLSASLSIPCPNPVLLNI